MLWGHFEDSCNFLAVPCGRYTDPHQLPVTSPPYSLELVCRLCSPSVASRFAAMAPPRSLDLWTFWLHTGHSPPSNPLQWLGGSQTHTWSLHHTVVAILGSEGQIRCLHKGWQGISDESGMAAYSMTGATMQRAVSSQATKRRQVSPCPCDGVIARRPMARTDRPGSLDKICCFPAE